MSKVYDEKCLERLLPNYSFYQKKKISNEVQKLYKMGYATKDQMYQRLTFPIYNEHKQIIGFSGRHLYWEPDSKFPKWKHLGRKDQWIYPYYSIRESQEFFGGEINMVESIGDSMALTENKLFSHVVNFGLDCSSALLAFLMLKDPELITISTNNDSHKEKNTGKIAAIKNLMKLSTVFPVDMLRIKLPTLNDVSEMQEKDENIVEWHKSGEILQKKEILETINLYREKFQADKLAKFLKKYE